MTFPARRFGTKTISLWPCHPHFLRHLTEQASPTAGSEDAEDACLGLNVKAEHGNDQDDSTAPRVD